MKDKKAMLLRIMSAALIIAAIVMGDRGTTVILCSAGVLGVTANRLDGGAGRFGNIVKKKNG